MRVLGPLIVVTCFALSYAAMFPAVRRWANGIVPEAALWAVVVVVLIVGVGRGFAMAARLGDIARWRVWDRLIGVCIHALVALTQWSARTVQRLAAFRMRLTEGSQ